VRSFGAVSKAFYKKKGGIPATSRGSAWALFAKMVPIEVPLANGARSVRVDEREKTDVPTRLSFLDFFSGFNKRCVVFELLMQRNGQKGDKKLEEKKTTGFFHKSFWHGFFHKSCL
jgi:hypothetical protein